MNCLSLSYHNQSHRRVIARIVIFWKYKENCYVKVESQVFQKETKGKDNCKWKIFVIKKKKK